MLSDEYLFYKYYWKISKVDDVTRLWIGYSVGLQIGLQNLKCIFLKILFSKLINSLKTNEITLILSFINKRKHFFGNTEPK